MSISIGVCAGMYVVSMLGVLLECGWGIMECTSSSIGICARMYEVSLYIESFVGTWMGDYRTFDV